MSKNKNTEKIKNRTRNFKINTRIVITSVLAIVIPLIIIASFASVFISVMASKFDFSSVTTNSYSFVNQIQWNQEMNDISNTLVSEKDDRKKLEILNGLISPAETIGCDFHIEKNGKLFYETKNAKTDFSKINSEKNVYSFADNDLTIINHIYSENDEFTVIVKSSSYFVPDSSLKNETNSLKSLITNRTIIIVAVIVGIFILTIVIISLITSKTIVSPINKISKGADEIANGNFDYEIDYRSTNELGMLADNFNNMSRRVKESAERQYQADMHQKEMIAGIAHDLRTPLTSVKGYVEGLRDGIADTPEKQRRYLETIYTSTCDTEKMLDDLLTISKLELGNITLNYEKVNVNDFLNFAKDVGGELAKEDFEFEIINNTKTNPALLIDTDRFSRVIRNIVSNSVKYRRNDVKGKIIFNVSEYSQSVIIEVKDNGTGVDKESLPRIFDTLYRADKARSNVRDGSGLGLSVCKQIIELHGGMIWAQSEPGEGLSVFISMPIYKEENSNEENIDS